MMAAETQPVKPIESRDALALALDASANPLATLRYLVREDRRLADALALADEQFNEWEASQLVHEASVALGIIAAAMKAHSLSCPFPLKRVRAKKIAAEEVPS
jgi:hypothetical protein